MDKVGGQGDGDGTDQIGHKDKGAFEYPDDYKFLSLVILTDFLPHLLDAVLYGLTVQNKFFLACLHGAEVMKEKMFSVSLLGRENGTILPLFIV